MLTSLLAPSRSERIRWRRDWTVLFEALTIGLHQPAVASICNARQQRWCRLVSEITEAGIADGTFLPAVSAPAAVGDELMALVDGLASRLLQPCTTITHDQALGLALAAAGRLGDQILR